MQEKALRGNKYVISIASKMEMATLNLKGF